MFKLLVFKRAFSTSILFRNNATANTAASASTKTSHPPSSCLEGTPLNLLLKKGGKEPLALKDEEYPDWLWNLLDSKKQVERLKSIPMAFERKQQKKKNVAKIKSNNFEAQL